MRLAARHLLSIGLAVCASLTVGARADDKVDPKERERIRGISAKFADCAVKQNAPAARAIVLNNAHGGMIWDQAGKLISGACLNRASDTFGARMTFPGDLFLYSIAEALVRVDYAAPVALDFTTRQPLAHRKPEPVDAALAARGNKKAKDAQAAYERKQTVYLTATWGECVARRDSAKVHALLLAPLSSPEERAGFAALATTFGDCLGKGRARFTKQVARGTLAVNFYRLAGAPAGAAIKALKVS